jgi:DNA-binding NtrC family response regulator
MSQRRQARLLVVEDNDTLRRGICRALRESWSEVNESSAGDEAIAHIGDASVEPYDVVVSDLRLPGADGVAVLRAALERDSRTSVLMMTAYGSIETAVEAMRAGAFDFVQKPLDLEQIELRVARAVDHRRLLREVSELRAERAARHAADDIVAESPALRAALELAGRVAPTRSTVLLTGETGTGKEVIAGLIHRLSPRENGPLVKVNCAALPETLLESELFGHERGAFTGADRQRIGRFEQASGGTLFLDEVGELSAAFQVKLLRALQEGEVQPLGSAETMHVDVRLIAATNRDLRHMMEEGTFREDLFYRLCVIPIHIPPLRERREDIVPLVEHYLPRLAARTGKDIGEISPDALAALYDYDYPGNVRELANILERAFVLCHGEEIDIGHLPPEVVHAEARDATSPLESRTSDRRLHPEEAAEDEAAASPPAAESPLAGEWAWRLKPSERKLFSSVRTRPDRVSRNSRHPDGWGQVPPEVQRLLDVLHAHGWNRGATADALGISRSTLWRRMMEYGLLRAGAASPPHPPTGAGSGRSPSRG